MNSMARACSMVVNLLFPRCCAGCDKPDEVLCEACRALFSQPTAQSFDGVAMQRWFACGWYRGTVRKAVLAWKDHGDEECDRAFADAICALAKASGVIDFVRDRHGSCHDVVVVPAPSSPASIRRRGRKHMMPIAKHLAGFLREETGCEVTVRDALENRGVKEKSVQTSGAAQRSQRLKGHVSVCPSVSLRNTMVILVDDIVTTGATMRSCVETMRKEGATVVTVLALAHTPAGTQKVGPTQAWSRTQVQ